MEFFNNIEKIKYEGLESNNMLAFVITMQRK